MAFCLVLSTLAWMQHLACKSETEDERIGSLHTFKAAKAYICLEF